MMRGVLMGMTDMMGRVMDMVFCRFCV